MLWNLEPLGTITARAGLISRSGGIGTAGPILQDLLEVQEVA